MKWSQQKKKKKKMNVRKCRTINRYVNVGSHKYTLRDFTGTKKWPRSALCSGRLRVWRKRKKKKK